MDHSPDAFAVPQSREKNFICTDLIDTPGLVDGDMQVRSRVH